MTHARDKIWSLSPPTHVKNLFASSFRFPLDCGERIQLLLCRLSAAHHKMWQVQLQISCKCFFKSYFSFRLHTCQFMKESTYESFVTTGNKKLFSVFAAPWLRVSKCKWDETPRSVISSTYGCTSRLLGMVWGGGASILRALSCP